MALRHGQHDRKHAAQMSVPSMDSRMLPALDGHRARSHHPPAGGRGEGADPSPLRP